MKQVEQQDLCQAMSVEQLLNELLGEWDENALRVDKDSHVVLQCNYGDYYNTQQLILVSEVREFEGRDETIRESAYSQSGFAISNNGEDEEYLRPHHLCPDCGEGHLDHFVLSCGVI